MKKLLVFAVVFLLVASLSASAQNWYYFFDGASTPKAVSNDAGLNAGTFIVGATPYHFAIGSQVARWNIEDVDSNKKAIRIEYLSTKDESRIYEFGPYCDDIGNDNPYSPGCSGPGIRGGVWEGLTVGFRFKLESYRPVDHYLNIWGSGTDNKSYAVQRMQTTFATMKPDNSGPFQARIRLHLWRHDTGNWGTVSNWIYPNAPNGPRVAGMYLGVFQPETWDTNYKNWYYRIDDGNWHTVWVSVRPKTDAQVNGKWCCEYKYWVDGTLVGIEYADRGGADNAAFGWRKDGRACTFQYDWWGLAPAAYDWGSGPSIPTSDRSVQLKATIGEAKAAAENTIVRVENKQVTGRETAPFGIDKAFSSQKSERSFVYVEEDDRSAGMKLSLDTGHYFTGPVSPLVASGTSGGPLLLTSGTVTSLPTVHSGPVSVLEQAKITDNTNPVGWTTGQYTNYFLVLDKGTAQKCYIITSMTASVDGDPTKNQIGFAQGTRMIGDGFSSGNTYHILAERVSMNDSSKSWTTNEFKNRHIILNGSKGKFIYKVGSNTASTLKISAGNLAADGIWAGSSYEVVHESVLSCPGKNFTPNAFAGYLLKINRGGIEKWYDIVSNTADTITIGFGNLAYDGVQSGDTYEVRLPEKISSYNTATVLTDTTANFTPNAFANKWLRLVINGKAHWYKIASNGTQTITIQSGNMLADGASGGERYQVLDFSAKGIQKDILPGDRVTFEGAVYSGECEKQCAPTYLEMVQPVANSGAKEPLTLNNKAVAWSRGPAGVTGLDADGLFVTLTGKVTYVQDGAYAPDLDFVYLDDGTGFVDYSGIIDPNTNEPVKGIRVYINIDQVGSIIPGDYMIVNGCVGNQRICDASIAPAVDTAIPVIWANPNPYQLFEGPF